MFAQHGQGSSAEAQVDISLLPVSFGGKCGYVDASGKMVINPQFDNAAAFNTKLGLAPIQVGKKWGLIDHDGKYVVNPQFDSVEIKSDNKTIGVALGGKVGTVDSSGAFVINPQFDYLSDFDAKAHAIASVGQKYGIIDATGKFLVSPEFDQIFSDKAWNPESRWDILAGPILVRQGDKYGFIDATGKIVIQPQFSAASPFTAGELASAAIEQPDNEALSQIQAKNSIAAQTTIRNGIGNLLADDFSQSDATLTFTINNPAMTVAVDNWLGQNLPGLWSREAGSMGDFKLVQQVDAPTKNVYGYIDHSGKFLISPQFGQAGPFTESGLASIVVGNLAGYVDTTGKIVINPQFADSNPFLRVKGEWLAVVSIPGDGSGNPKYGLIDTKGNYKITPQFDGLQSLSPDGYAVASSGELWGAVDMTGKYVVQPIYATLFAIGKTGKFFFAKAAAESKEIQEIGIIDAAGKAVTSVRGGMCSSSYTLAQQ